MTLQAGELESHAVPGFDEAEGAEEKVVGRSPTQLAVARFRKDKLSMTALAICLVYVVGSIAGPDPRQARRPEDGGVPPGPAGPRSWRHPQGQPRWDQLPSHPLGVEPGTGRDVLSRIALGTTYSLTIALTACVLTIVIGAVLGIISGFSGGIVDSVVGRIIDLTLSFPAR